MNYRSIFLAKDWAHQAYYGWRISHELPHLRILTKRYMVAARHLILLEAAGRHSLDRCVSEISGNYGLSDIFVHDFDRVLGASPLVGGLAFKQIDQDQRILNTATFVIDISRSDAELLEQMSSDYRRKIRKAREAGITVEAHEHPSDDLRTLFFDSLNAFAAKRKLRPVGRGTLAQMYAGGHATLFVIRAGGNIRNFLHTYKTGNIATFMYGVNISKENDGSGQFLHFEAMRYLRNHGVRWYDLGGVARVDSSDGIFNFKQKFGGDLVDLGGEFRHTGPLLSAALAGFRAASRIRRGELGKGAIGRSE